MATPSILYVGVDICRRIPVMGTIGFRVCQSEDSVPAIREAFAGGDSFSVVSFHTDVYAIRQNVISITRTLSAALLVLFESAYIYQESSVFDLVVPALTPPDCWLEELCDLMETSRRLQKESQQLCLDCARVRSTLRETRAKSARLRVIPIDLEALWRGEDEW